MLKKSFP